MCSLLVVPVASEWFSYSARQKKRLGEAINWLSPHEPAPNLLTQVSEVSLVFLVADVSGARGV